MPNDAFAEIFNRLLATQFRDISGAHFSGTIPVPERMINEAIAASLPAGGHVREVQVRPERDDRFSVKITPRSGFFPSITLKLAIERQPEFPNTPVLVLRLETMGGLLGFAGGAIGNMLPPGVRLDGDRILVDLRAMATQRGFGDFLQFVRQLRVNTEEGRVILQVDAAV